MECTNGFGCADKNCLGARHYYDYCRFSKADRGYDTRIEDLFQRSLCIA